MVSLRAPVQVVLLLVLSVADLAFPDLHHALKPLQRGEKMLLWLDHLSSLCYMFKNQDTFHNVS